jgi:DNA-binding XRE family transcriptional regulator
MDQRELALVAAVSPRTVHAVEHGKETLRLDVLVRVLQGVGLDLKAVSRGPPEGAPSR